MNISPILEKETKMTSPVSPNQQKQEIRQAFGQFLTAFEQFKQENDLRLQEMEKKGSADSLLDEKLGRIDASLQQQQKCIDNMQISNRQPTLFGAGEARDAAEQKSALHRYMRAGVSTALESKAASVGTDSAGGYLVPSGIEGSIVTAVRDQSVFRQIASSVTSSKNVYRLAVSQGDEAVGWVGETDARPETASPSIDAIDIPSFELYAMPAATQTLLDDSAVNVENWLTGEVQNAFAEQENDAFVNGDGTTKPKGFLTYSITDDASHSWGDIGYVVTGSDGDFDATNPMDALLDLIHAPKAAHRQNGRFVMNKSTLAEVRKFKDNDGNYLWQPARTAGETSSLLGYPVSELESMPDIAADSYSIAFGDFKRFYTIFDRKGISILRDPYSNKPYVLFYVVRRVGGGVQDFHAVKLLKFGTS